MKPKQPLIILQSAIVPPEVDIEKLAAYGRYTKEEVEQKKADERKRIERTPCRRNPSHLGSGTAE